MNKPVRKRTDADATETNQLDVTGIFCGKLLSCPAIVARKRPEPKPKRETRPGGQPDGSSHMGAWGGWALAPNKASMGRDNRSHRHKSPEGRPTFKSARGFFNLLGGSPRGRKSLRGRAISLAGGRLAGGYGGRRLVQGPGRR